MYVYAESVPPHQEMRLFSTTSGGGGGEGVGFWSGEKGPNFRDDDLEIEMFIRVLQKSTRIEEATGIFTRLAALLFGI